MRKKWQIPLDNNGKILFDTYSVNYNIRCGLIIEYIDIYEFTAPLIICNYYRGRIAVGIYVKNYNTGEQYAISMSNFVNAIKKLKVINGVMEPTKWTFEKKGTHISLKLAEEEKKDE